MICGFEVRPCGGGSMSTIQCWWPVVEAKGAEVAVGFALQRRPSFGEEENEREILDGLQGEKRKKPYLQFTSCSSGGEVGPRKPMAELRRSCNTVTDVVAANQGTDVVVVEDNTTATVDVANINANVFIGRKRTRRTFCDTTTLTFEMFSKYFYLTADQAAEELQTLSLPNFQHRSGTSMLSPFSSDSEDSQSRQKRRLDALCIVYRGLFRWCIEFKHARAA
nr:hypothetical protein Iba_chr11eCG11350 [Ipomoea batatas]